MNLTSHVVPRGTYFLNQFINPFDSLSGLRNNTNPSLIRHIKYILVLFDYYCLWKISDKPIHFSVPFFAYDYRKESGIN